MALAVQAPQKSPTRFRCRRNFDARTLPLFAVTPDFGGLEREDLGKILEVPKCPIEILPLLDRGEQELQKLELPVPAQTDRVEKSQHLLDLTFHALLTGKEEDIPDIPCGDLVFGRNEVTDHDNTP